MRKYLSSFLTLMICAALGNAQTVINLPGGEIPGVTYENDERRYYSEVWKTTVVTNVSSPTLIVYEPSENKRNGTSVIIAPGGGLYGLSINSEGQDVAQWLAAKGVTAFVLKYRLVPTGEDGTQEIEEEWGKDYTMVMEKVDKVLPTSIKDGLNAVEYVRSNADKYNLDPDKIGFMGFSAGGAVAMGVGYNYGEKSRPDFLIPVYPWTDALSVQVPPADAPPMIIICATDDGIGLAKGAIELYGSYLEKGLNVALHMYAKGDHGFGMKIQGLPSDSWMERVYDWAVSEQFIVPRKHF